MTYKYAELQANESLKSPRFESLFHGLAEQYKG